jgi:hypothetical protein
MQSMTHPYSYEEMQETLYLHMKCSAYLIQHAMYTKSTMVTLILRNQPVETNARNN